MIWCVIVILFFSFFICCSVYDFFDTRKRKKKFKEDIKAWALKVQDLEEQIAKENDFNHRVFLESKWEVTKSYPPVYEKEDNDFSWTLAIIGTLCLAFIGFCLVAILNTLSGSIIYSQYKNTVTEEYTALSWNITALQDNFGVSGQFFLHRGTLNSELFYTYTYNTDKGLKTRNLPADRTYVQFTDNNYHIEKHDYKWNKNWVKLFCFFDAEDYSSNDYYYIAYVPYGSVISDGQYQIDLK